MLTYLEGTLVLLVSEPDLTALASYPSGDIENIHLILKQGSLPYLLI